MDTLFNHPLVFAQAIFIKFLCGAWLVASISISDGLELFTNPDVHFFHNCPDIIQIPWKQYTVYHAAKSGFICSWWLIIVCMFLPRFYFFYFILGVTNILLPLVLRVFQGEKPGDIYLCHTFLYINNAGMLGGMALFVVPQLILN